MTLFEITVLEGLLPIYPSPLVVTQVPLVTSGMVPLLVVPLVVSLVSHMCMHGVVPTCRNHLEGIIDYALVVD